MNIELLNLTVGDLAKGYEDNQESGVVAYEGNLDIRPPYQREFVYNDKQRAAVIDTLTRKFPLNVMYWAVRDDGRFEVIDGQQRTISICQYVDSDFSFNGRYFHNLQVDEKAIILEYPLMVYLCSGADSEKLAWFRTINIAGVKLTEQELRNASFSGPWVSDAKRYFSKTGCAASGIGGDYVAGIPNRQDILETVICWISDDKIEAYMAEKQHKPNANELWLYFQSVINWVKATFPHYRSEMKGLPWGPLYNKHKDDQLDPKVLEASISRLMADEDVGKKGGIYSYVLDGRERHLNIRAFSDNMRREAYERQKGICPICKKHWEISEMHADHITPWHLDGKTEAANCQMLCAEDNRRKSGI